MKWESACAHFNNCDRIGNGSNDENKRSGDEIGSDDKNERSGDWIGSVSSSDRIGNVSGSDGIGNVSGDENERSDNGVKNVNEIKTACSFNTHCNIYWYYFSDVQLHADLKKTV